jgi:hypothetical protein
MSNYDNNNQGAIWKNDKRQTDKHPHFTGSATINGVDYYVSAWKRDSESNPKAPALKFSVTPKDAPKAPPKPETDAPFNDDIPF